LLRGRDESLKFSYCHEILFEKYVTSITLTKITVTEMTEIASSTFALQAAPAHRAAAREEARRQIKQMSQAMIEEKGLLNHAQAALLLDVSTKRVGELVRLGKLTDFAFLGRKYVSMREVEERSKQELKAGRPPRSTGKRVIASLRAATKTDRIQARLGGYSGQYQKDLKRKAKEKYSLRKLLRSERDET
jgi:hypothetical protein